jgi:hypothetical protein
MAKHRKPLRAEQPSPSFFASLSPLKQDLLCIAFLYIITLVLFRGIVFGDMAFSTSGDTANAVTIAKVGDEIRENEGVDPLWMPGFFSGMPTFGNVHYVPHDVSYLQRVVVSVLDLLYLKRTWSWFAVYYLFCGVFTFFLLRVWKLSRIAALFGAITFMLSPYAIALAAEGHGSKLMALSYLPAVVLLTHLVFERRDILSFGLLAAAIGTLLLTNHLQIVYYVLMVVGLYLLYHVVRDFKAEKRLIPLKAALLAGALVLGLGISSYIYLSVYEYAQYSIRGGGTTGATGGLTWEYATNWSFHPKELLTLIVPSFFGFSSQYLYNWQGTPTPLPLYWGTMPFNTSTVYFGVVPILFAAIALVYRRNAVTIFFAILAAVVTLMSFGKHFALLYEVLFNILPFFDKFRAPAMILHLLAFAFAVLGAQGVHYMIEERGKEFNAAKFKKVLYYVLGAVGIVLLLGLMMRSSLFEMFGFSFVREGESYGAQTQQILAEFKKIRFDILWKDYIKFCLLVGVAIGALIFYVNAKLKALTFSAIIFGVLLVDLFIVDTRFIDPKPRQNLDQSFLPDATISHLKQQPGLFRVFPVGDLFGDTQFAYHGLQSIGGYSPAKLKIYQTVLDSCLYRAPDPEFPINMSIVNMLNVRYLVAKGQLPADRFEMVNVDQTKRILTYRNPNALPRAFFVKNVVHAESDTEVFRILNSPAFNPAETGVLGVPVPEGIGAPESTYVSVAGHQAHRIVLKAYASSPALLVLSEVYYPAGWNAYINGEQTPVYRTNYILRSIVVPAGEHEIEFRFEPATYALGWTITHIAWGVVAVCLLIGVWRSPWAQRKLRRSGTEHVPVDAQG